MDLPYSYKKLIEMRLDIVADEILFISDLLFGIVKEPKKKFFHKYFNPLIKLSYGTVLMNKAS